MSVVNSRTQVAAHCFLNERTHVTAWLRIRHPTLHHLHAIQSIKTRVSNSFCAVINYCLKVAIQSIVDRQSIRDNGRPRSQEIVGACNNDCWVL